MTKPAIKCRDCDFHGVKPHPHEGEPPDDWWSYLYKRRAPLTQSTLGWFFKRGFLYRTIREDGHFCTYRWQWRFWRGPYWKFKGCPACNHNVTPQTHLAALCAAHQREWSGQ